MSMSEDTPHDRHAALRTDLRISRQEAPEGAVYVLKQPDSGAYFRFREAEHFIARQLDGRTSLEEIRRRAAERFGSEVPAAAVERFVGRLRHAGLLQGAAAPAPSRPGGRIRGDALYLRFRIMDPDRLLGWLATRLGFFFTPWFFLGSGALILAAMAVTVDARAEIAADVAALFRLDVLLFAWVTVLSVSALHEMAHGLTCKRFGGEVHEIGFLIIYLQPALYCNVSDAWLFPEKSRRLWVTFSGAYFEIVIWAASTLVWRMVEPGSGLSEAALVVMATSGIKTLFNWNPLIKLDGYYLLGDLLGIPNLRAKAFARLRELFGRIPPPAPAASGRERRVLLAYGLLAGAYSMWLMGMIATHLGGYLVGRYQGAGAVLFAVAMGGFFRGTVKKALAPLGRIAGLSGPPAPSPPTARRERLRERLRSVRQAAGRLGPRARAIILGAALLGILVCGRMEHKVAGEFRVLPYTNADVRAGVAGLIEEALVREGDRVRAGDILVRLSDRDLRAELGQVQAEIDHKAAVLRMLQGGPRPEEVGLARREIAKAITEQEHAARQLEESERIHAEDLARQQAAVTKGEAELAAAGRDLERAQALAAAGLVPRQEVEDAGRRLAVRRNELAGEQAKLRMIQADVLAEARKDLAVAVKEVEAAEARLRVLRAGAPPEEIEAQRADLAALESRRNHLEDQIRRTRVTAPHDGIIATPALEEKIGAKVEKGDLILEVHAYERLMAEIAVPEKEIGSVRPGQPVVLKSRAFPERRIHGRVSAVAPAVEAEEGGWGRTFVRVRAEIEAPGAPLRAAMTGQAKILCGRRSILHILTRRVTRYLRVEFWSWW
jgi:multidrug resistance efflux pump